MKKLAIGLIALLGVLGFATVSVQAFGAGFGQVRVKPTPIGAEKTPISKDAPEPTLPYPKHEPKVMGGPGLELPVTTDHIRNFLSAKAGVLPGMSSHPATITSIEFLTLGEAFDSLLITREALFAPATEPIAFVRLEGAFTIPSEDNSQTLLNMTHGYMIFDATTGRLLSSGVK